MGFFSRLFGPRQRSGETPEFEELLERSWTQLEGQNRELSGYLHKMESWKLDEAAEKLVFTFPDKTATTSAQAIGTFERGSETWQWAWSNKSWPKALVLYSEYVRAFGAERGIGRLTERKIAATEEEAWLLAALANHLCGSLGCRGVYRAPSGKDVLVFFTVGEMEESPRGEVT